MTKFIETGEGLEVGDDVDAMDKSDSSRVLDTNGWYEIPGNPISKVGVFKYMGRTIPGADPERIYNVFRSAAELGSEATINSLRLLPWIDDHVMLGASAKGLKPAEEKTVHGVIGEKVYFEGDTLFANIKLFSEALADLIASGKKELSLGYRCKYVHAPGVVNGEEYEYLQVDIRANHLALVDEGRMGADVAVLDAFVFTFDAKEITKMPDPIKPEDGGAATMSVADALAAVTALLPVLQKLSGLAGAGTPPAEVPPAAIGDADPEVPDPAAAKDEETEEEKAAREKKEKEAGGAADAEPDDKEKKDAAAMDAAIARHLRGNVSTVVKALAARDKLAAQVAAHVGTFDHAEMTGAEVAAYGIKKLGIKAPAGQDAAYLAGYLQAAKAPAAQAVSRQAVGMDSAHNSGADNFVTKFLGGK